MKRKILVIVGPTAVGKSDLAVRLAKKLNGEIISADSRQVYCGLNIGTGKITKKEMAGVPHYLLDVANPKKQFSAADFVRLGREKIAAIFSRGHTPIICGGTGFYISALLGEIELAPAPPNPKLRAQLAKKSASELFEMLKKLDPARAEKIDHHNPRRLIRAIEVALSKEKEIKVEPFFRSKVQPFKVIKIGLTLPPEKLKKKIRTRLLARLKQGMIAEAEKLHQQGLSWKRMNELGLEYRYLAKYLKNNPPTDGSKEEMIEKLFTEIWRYAKRQMTWFKKDKNIHWFLPNNFKKIWTLTQGQGPSSNR
ncbi:MAG: tRNA (adenosine(37)-N6)-dimethylallyltransferase MiaA [Candidatus Paceibacterota bacterium]|jgi:tRNA dimethylallyltransferase